LKEKKNTQDFFFFWSFPNEKIAEQFSFDQASNKRTFMKFLLKKLFSRTKNI